MLFKSLTSLTSSIVNNKSSNIAMNSGNSQSFGDNQTSEFVWKPIFTTYKYTTIAGNGRGY